MGINSYANWKRLKNCKDVLIAIVMTKLHISSEWVIQVMLFPQKFSLQQILLAVFHPATCCKTLASDISQSNDVYEKFLSIDSENYSVKLNWENRHASLIFYITLVQELMSVLSLTHHSWISQGVELLLSDQEIM